MKTFKSVCFHNAFFNCRGFGHNCLLESSSLAVSSQNSNFQFMSLAVLNIAKHLNNTIFVLFQLKNTYEFIVLTNNSSQVENIPLSMVYGTYPFFSVIRLTELLC